MDIEFLFVSSVGQKGKDNEDKVERGLILWLLWTFSHWDKINCYN